MPNTYTQSDREQAARVMSQLKEAMPYKDSGEFDTTIVMEAYDTAIAVLRGQGWVRTSERAPTKEDALDGEVLFADRYGLVGAYSYTTADYTYEDGGLVYPYWMPLLPLPEVDNG